MTQQLVARMLVPTDGSQGATEAAAYAATLARQLGARVTLLHVVEIPPVPMPPIGVPVPLGYEQLREELTEAGQAILATTAKPFTQVGIPVETELREGPVAETIDQVAAQGRYDLIVIGSRGKSGAARLLLGSVSEAVARTAPCPVLIFRRGGIDQ